MEAMLTWLVVLGLFTWWVIHWYRVPLGATGDIQGMMKVAALVAIPLLVIAWLAFFIGLPYFFDPR